MTIFYLASIVAFSVGTAFAGTDQTSSGEVDAATASDFTQAIPDAKASTDKDSSDGPKPVLTPDPTDGSTDGSTGGSTGGSTDDMTDDTTNGSKTS